MPKKQIPHIVSPYKVWSIEGKRTDNGNVLYYRIWADNAHLAKRYLERAWKEDGVPAVMTTEPKPLIGDGVYSAVYDETLNCKRSDPARFHRWMAQYDQP